MAALGFGSGLAREPLQVVEGAAAGAPENAAGLAASTRPAPEVRVGGGAPAAAALSHAPAEVVRARIHELWFARKEALESSDTMLAAARVEELRAFLAQEGITADRDIARAFAYEGYENLREGNYERAREAFHVAGSFDPWLPQAQMGYAWSLLRSGRGVVTFVNEYGHGVRLAWSQLLASELELTNLATACAAALLVGCVLFSLVVVARCQARARHDLFEMLRRAIPERLAKWCAWVVFLLPLLVWAGGVWAVLYWLALCYRYMRGAEKTVAAAVFVMLGLSPLGVGAMTARFEASTDPEVRVVIAAMQAGYSPDTVRALEELVRVHPDSPELHLALGGLYTRGDRLGEAFDTFQRVLQLSPGSAAALVDTGNVYHRLGEFAQAVKHYKEALQGQPDLAAAWWNMHLAQSELLHFAEADESLSRARSLDGSLVGRLLSSKKQGGDILVELPADLATVKRELREGRSSGSQPLAVFDSRLSLASGGALVAALLLALWGRQANACERCGRPHCARCAMDHRSASLCARCAALFLRKDGIPAEVRTQELARLGRRERAGALLRRLLSILLPGSGHILSGRLALGLPLMMLWSGALVFLLSRERLLLSPRVPVSDLPPPSVAVAVVLMALLWIAGNTVSTRPERWTERDHGA